MKIRIITLIATLLLVGCGKKEIDGILFRDDFTSSAPQITMVAQLERIISSDPIQDANEAFRRKDLRFVGVVGIALFTPGVDRSKQEAKEIKTIVWTSDAMRNETHVELNHEAGKYAESYNIELSRLIELKKMN